MTPRRRERDLDNHEYKLFLCSLAVTHRKERTEFSQKSRLERTDKSSIVGEKNPSSIMHFGENDVKGNNGGCIRQRQDISILSGANRPP